MRTFEVAEIKQVPNIQGAHGLAAYLPSCKYVFVNGELETDAAGNSTDSEKYRSMVAFLDAQTLETKFEVSFVGNADAQSSGKDGRYVFVTAISESNRISRSAAGALGLKCHEARSHSSRTSEPPGLTNRRCEATCSRPRPSGAIW